MDPLGFAWESVIILECSMIDGSVVAVSGTVVIVWLIKAIVFRSKLPSFAQSCHPSQVRLGALANPSQAIKARLRQEM